MALIISVTQIIIAMVVQALNETLYLDVQVSSMDVIWNSFIQERDSLWKKTYI